MKKAIVFTLCAAIMLSAAACSHASKPEESSSALVGQLAQVPNPFVSCDTLEEAGKLAGFDITVPTEIKGYDQDHISVMEKTMIQVSFKKGDDEIYFRKGVGAEDISGDYNSYSSTSELTVGPDQVTMKGDGDQVHTAIWTDGGFSYAIGSTIPLEKDTMKQYVETMMGEG